MVLFTLKVAAKEWMNHQNLHQYHILSHYYTCFNSTKQCSKVPINYTTDFWTKYSIIKRISKEKKKQIYVK